jgi:plasmid maintenance system antidote protein VapI
MLSKNGAPSAPYCFGMSADFWMSLQLRWDLYFAQKEAASALQEIHPYGYPAD